MSADLATRILDAFPSGSYSLSAFLRLLDIVETERIPTAAVECRVQPRLLINPSFVATHAATPQKLLMLVMHELHHVLLGHTTLFPRTTPVQNFVFDAVINGLVCRMFPRAEFTAFFRDYYPADHFPTCLLAPPPDWPPERRGQPQPIAPGIAQLDGERSKRAHAVHRALYSPTGASYREVYDLLPKLLVKPGGRTGKAPADDALFDDVPLLGNHGDDELREAGLEHRSPLLFDIVRDVVEQWPQPPDPIRGRSMADVLNEQTVVAKRAPSNRTRLRRLIRKIAGARGGGVHRIREDRTEATTPIPSLARRSLVLQALGQQPLLHPGPVALRRRAPSGERVHVYLDVSGSMHSVLPALYGAIVDCRELVAPAVHLFSTKVADITLAELRAGKCSSTGGTDLNCVVEHMTRRRIRRALIVTDGWVGKPRGEHVATLTRMQLAVAYLGPSVNETDLEDVARHTCTLTTETSR